MTSFFKAFWLSSPVHYYHACIILKSPKAFMFFIRIYLFGEKMSGKSDETFEGVMKFSSDEKNLSDILSPDQNF